MSRTGPQPAEPVESAPGREATEASDVLRRYLREVGATPLLDEREEARLANRLWSARVAIAQLAQALPESCRALVLAGDESGPTLGAAWPLRRLERFLREFAHHAARRPDAAVAAALREIRAHKASLDRARNGLILANLRLVVHVAKKYARRGLSLTDLIQEGNVGLLRAVEKFEHERGYKLSTYAFWWIKQGIERAITDKSRTIRIPAHASRRVRSVELVARDLERRFGRKATPRDIASQLGMPVKTVDQALSVVREPLPLDSGADSLGTGYDVAQFVPDERAPCPFQDAAQRQMNLRVVSVLRQLNPREEKVLRMRFGIGHDATRTLEQIGEQLQLSRERVRQIEAVALLKLRTSPLGRDFAGFFGVGKKARPSRGRASVSKPIQSSLLPLKV